MNKPTHLLLILILFGANSCGPSTTERETMATQQPNSQELKESLIQQNRQLIAEEIEMIDAYVERHGLKLDTTSTGLRYKILEKTDGREVRLMKDVTLSYTASLLNGDLCYSSDTSGQLSFTIGQSNQPSGLQEGILKMRQGEKAIFIVPSYLGYGITGDGLCIPGSTSILYRVELEKVSQQ